jgi:NIMA (never in mitosis gene a)-related kinase
MIVMEHCEGGDLKDIIEAESPLSEEKIMTWMYQICDAVKFIHAHDIIHRDMKSQNVFIMKDGSARLGDFGLCTKTMKFKEGVSRAVT